MEKNQNRQTSKTHKTPQKTCPIPAEVQGQAGLGSEQPDLVGGVRPHGVGVGIR